MQTKRFRLPRTVCAAAVCVSLVAATSADAAQFVYATVDWSDENNHLLRIDVVDGGVTDIGACTILGQPSYKPGLPGLSWHVDGYLYAFDTYGNQILRIDPTSAEATVVTDVGADLGGYMNGLAIASDGTYYLTDWQLRTGTLPGPSVLVGGNALSDTDSCDLASDGTLWATDSGALLTIDKTTGNQTVLRQWTNADIAGIAVDGSFAWAIDRGDNSPGNQWLVTIDLSTGDLTYVHNLPDGYYLATAVPEPVTLAFLSLGGFAVMIRHRRMG